MSANPTYYVNASTTLIQIDSSQITYPGNAIVYLSSLNLPGSLVTIRDIYGAASTNKGIIISTTFGNSFVNGAVPYQTMSSVIIQQPYGYVTVTPRTSTIWNLLNSFGMPQETQAFNINTINVNNTAFVSTIVASNAYISSASVSSISTNVLTVLTSVSIGKALYVGSTTALMNNVGISTLTPAYTLDVNGTMYASTIQSFRMSTLALNASTLSLYDQATNSTGVLKDVSSFLYFNQFLIAGSRVAPIQYAVFNTVEPITPSAPSATIVFLSGTSYLTVSWTGGTPFNSATVVIYSSANPTNSGGSVFQTITGSTSPIVSTTPLVDGLYYYASVVTSNSGSQSSPGITGTTQQVYAAASAATSLVSSAISASGFTVSWSGATGATSFTYTLNGIPTTPSPSTSSSATFTGLSQARAYVVIVSATNLGGSTPSAPLTVTTTAQAPTAPTGLTFTNITSAGFTVSWTGGIGASSYTFSIGVPTTDNSLTSNSAIFTGLSPGTLYNVVISAINSGGTTVSSSSPVTTLVGGPTAITGVASSTITSTSISLTWSGGAGATSYTYAANNIPASASPDNGVSAQNATFTGLTPSTSYSFVITAINLGGNTVSSPFVVSTGPAAPQAATSLAGSSITSTGFTLGWLGASGATSYTYTLNGSAATPSTNNSSSDPPSVAFTSLAASTAYTVIVIATNAGGSTNSSPLTVTTSLGAPTAPTGLIASSITQNSATVTWSGATGATSFTYTVNSVATTPSSSTSSSASFSNLTAGTAYAVIVTAVNSGGSTASSSYTFTTLPLVPTAPTNLSTSSIGDTAITFTWTPGTGATSYTYTLNGSSATAASSTSSSATFTGLSVNTSYVFVVTAVNTGGSAPSSSFTARTTGPPPPAPSAPTGITFTSITSSGFTVSWSGGTNATSFSFTANGVTATASTYTGSPAVISGLLGGNTYSFIVTAINSTSSTQSSSFSVSLLPTVNYGSLVVQGNLFSSQIVIPTVNDVYFSVLGSNIYNGNTRTMMEIGSVSGQSGNYSSIYRYQLGYSNAGASFGGQFIIQSLATSGNSYAVAGPTVTHFSIDGLNKVVKVPGNLSIGDGGHITFDNSNITGWYNGITSQNFNSGVYYKMRHSTGNAAGYLLADYGFLGDSWNMTYNAHTNNGTWVIPNPGIGGSSRYIMGPTWAGWCFGNGAGHPSTVSVYMNSVGLGIGLGPGTPQFPLDVNGKINCSGELTIKSGRYINAGETHQISFQLSTGGYRHFITTRHDAKDEIVSGNAIDFWLNTKGNLNASSTAGTGNLNALSVTAKGIGIFTNSPQFPLDVMSEGEKNFSVVNYYLAVSGVFGGYSNGWLSVSIHASGTIWAEQVVIVSSDERIKKNISSSTDSLEIVNKLNLRSFEYIDVRARLERPVKHGLIAQELEKVYPEAVTKTIGFIPNIYTPAVSYISLDLSSVLITIDKPHELIEGDCVRVYINTDGKDDTQDFQYDTLVLRIYSNTSFVIAPWEAFELGRAMLVYGKKVNDLMGVNNPLIGVLAAGACQTLSKKNETLEQQVGTLQAQVASLQVQLNSLQSYVTSLLLKYPL